MKKLIMLILRAVSFKLYPEKIQNKGAKNVNKILAESQGRFGCDQ